MTLSDLERPNRTNLHVHSLLYPSTVAEKRSKTFVAKYRSSENVTCKFA